MVSRPLYLLTLADAFKPGSECHFFQIPHRTRPSLCDWTGTRKSTMGGSALVPEEPVRPTDRDGAHVLEHGRGGMRNLMVLCSPRAGMGGPRRNYAV